MLAGQFLAAGAATGKPGVFVELEERAEDARSNFSTLGLDLAGWEASGADVSWTGASDVSGIAGYKVYRAVDTTTYSVVATLPATASTDIQTGLSVDNGVYARSTKNNLGVLPSAASVVTPTTGMNVSSITSTLGPPRRNDDSDHLRDQRPQ